MRLADLEGAAVAVVALAAVAVGVVLYRQATAAARAVVEAAPEGSTGIDLAVAGVAGALGQTYGLPTPRQIAENRDACTSSKGWFEASKNCSAADFARWLRGDFDVSDLYPDESTRGSRRMSAS